MNIRPIPAVVSLLAGLITCIISFVQRVDIVVFAKRFVMVCVVFFVIGWGIQLILALNFKEFFGNRKAAEEALEQSEAEEKEDIDEDIEQPEADDKNQKNKE